MAQRRMFSLKIIDSDAFLDMPVSARELYFQLGMRADDDGFVNPKKIIRMVGATDDDLKLLIAKRFVLLFENGVIVIKHWLINNLIRKDFYQETSYIEEKAKLEIKGNKAYTEISGHMLTPRQQIVNNLSSQVRIDKVSIGKVNKDNINKDNTLAKKNSNKPGKESLPEIKNTDNNNNLATDVAWNKRFNELLNQFKNLNPNHEKLFRNKTERKALTELIEKYKFEKMENLLRMLPGIVEKPYAPKITTPYILQKKMGELIIFIKQEKRKEDSRGQRPRNIRTI